MGLTILSDAGPSDALPEGNVPPWLLADLAFFALEPPDVAPAEVQRFIYRDRPAYGYMPPPRRLIDPCEDCSRPETAYYFDADGADLGEVHSGLGYVSHESTLPDDFRSAIAGEVIWRSEPRSRTTAAIAASILGDARLALHPALIAYARLELDTGTAWRPRTRAARLQHVVKLDRVDAREPGVARGAAASDTAMRFLVQNRALFGFVDPVRELQLYDRGQSQPLTFAQTLDGQMVIGTWVEVGFDADGRVRNVESHYSPDVREDHANVSYAGAWALVAIEAARRHPGVQASDVGDPVAVWYDEEPPSLRYRVSVRGPERAALRRLGWSYEVDPTSGGVTEQ